MEEAGSESAKDAEKETETEQILDASGHGAMTPNENMALSGNIDKSMYLLICLLIQFVFISWAVQTLRLFHVWHPGEGLWGSSALL